MASNLPQSGYETGEQSYGQVQRRKFVLCFDGTGNKFQGNSGDSNILKIYSMLDRTDGMQFHYYQPGIGTYTASKSLSSDGMISKMSSWYNKTKDSAVGSTLDEHVMAGYKFLMRYYQTGDDIYFFGFSRGAYIARFLAELLDHLGLLSSGNEELVRFVWKTFAKWQTRQSVRSERERKEKDEMFKYMLSFRETFSRPVRRIRFLGLFDTVNSVSKFETAWMERSKRFPYTARSSALVIRHAVAIDERRAKFRQDLITQKNHHSPHLMHLPTETSANNTEPIDAKGRRFSNPKSKRLPVPREGSPSFRFRSHSRGRSRRTGRGGAGDQDRVSLEASPAPSDNYELDTDEEDENLEQDIEEIWFPGGHADIGGGWPADEPEKLALSHGPLVWMVREARKAGLAFLPDKMKELNCHYQESYDEQLLPLATPIPGFKLNDIAVDAVISPLNEAITPSDPDRELFLSALENSYTRARIHDCLSRSSGIGIQGVLTWRFMEYLPFKRMDLHSDGTWKAIRWPLPMGEVRDIPNNANVHNSAIRRMRFDESYRPGNLIIGGGGRGERVAPKESGIGEWIVLRDEGHPVGEVWTKKRKDVG